MIYCTRGNHTKHYTTDAVCKIQSDCPHGDQPGVAFVGETCENLVSKIPTYCYQEKVRSRCCASCAKHFSWQAGTVILYILQMLATARKRCLLTTMPILS
jgi:hypothetical protein